MMMVLVKRMATARGWQEYEDGIKIIGKNPSQSLVKCSESGTDVTIDEGTYRAEPNDMTLMNFSKYDTQNQANCVGLIVSGQSINCETDFVKTRH